MGTACLCLSNIRQCLCNRYPCIPEIIKRAIDTGIAINPDTGNISGDKSFLIIAGVAIVIVSLLRGAFSFGQTYLNELIGQRVAYDIRNKLYDRIQRLSYSFHDKAQTGQLMSRATQDVEGVRFFLSFGALNTISILIIFTGICIILFIMNWQLALISLACMPLVAYRAAKIGMKLRPLWMNIQEGIAKLGTVLQENLSGVKVVKAFSRQNYEQEKFREKAHQLYKDSLEASKVQAFNAPLMTFIFILASGLIIWYGGREVILGKLTAGELTQFYFYLGMMIMPVRMLGFMVNLISRGISSGERIYEILDTKSAVTEKPNATVLKDITGRVSFKDVSFSYGTLRSRKKEPKVLSNIQLDVKPGEMIALLGATGSGKTTLVNLIPRFYDVTEGSITIDDIDVRNVTLSSLRSNIGMVQQDVFLFSATIKDNIAYGAVNASMNDIISATKAAYLHEFIESLPYGYETWVGERGLNLSGGQKQRLAIARTLLINPRILIFDDSTSSVDTETEFLIQQAIRKLIKGRTTFVIAQRLQTVKDADQILVLDGGLVVERGTHQQLLKEGAIYQQIYELQLRDQEESHKRKP